jgi:glucokinase
MSKLVPALEIGGTHVCAGLVDLPGHQVLPATRRRLPLDAAAGAGAVVQQILDCAALITAEPDQPWGVAIPGPFDYKRGVALFQDGGKFEALYGVDLGRALRDRMAARPLSVSFINDANAFLLGEWIAGAATGHERAVGITLGTGIGSAFLDRGTLVEGGARVPPEGRADLLSYAGRPLEETVSRRAIRAHYGRLQGAERPDMTVDVREIAQRARDGEATAQRAIADAYTILGEVLAPWLRKFAPTVLVVGGSMAQSWDLIGARLRAGIARVEPRLLATLDILTAQLPDDASLIGAAWRAHRTRSDPADRSDDGGIASLTARDETTI